MLGVAMFMIAALSCTVAIQSLIAFESVRRIKRLEQTLRDNGIYAEGGTAR